MSHFSQSKTSCLAIKYISLERVMLDPKNARQHNARQIDQIANSIESFGFNVPILIDKRGKVIAGHGRVLACQKLGWNEVPSVQLEHLTEAQARAFAIADNRLTENSTWDERLLAENLKELSILDLEFSLEATGFTMGEIDLKIESLNTPEEESDPEDDIPELLTGAVTKPGDLWLLGKHRVLCGDSRESSSYERLLNGTQADLVFTDPPYNVPIQGHVSGNGNIKHREFAMASGEMSETEFINFLTGVFGLLASNSKSGSIHFICMDWRHIFEITTAGRKTYSDLKNVCVWTKNNGGMGSLYRSQHELVFVFKHGAEPHRNNVELGKYGRNRTNVWNYPGINAFGREDDEGNLLALHPTVKPVALISDAIMDCSSRGDIVLDNFLGSGSTLIAAEGAGRLCYGMEIDPLYIDISIRRWQKQTGKIAIHAESGLSFSEVSNVNSL